MKGFLDKKNEINKKKQGMAHGNLKTFSKLVKSARDSVDFRP